LGWAETFDILMVDFTGFALRRDSLCCTDTN